MIVFPNAKINLGLHVTSHRPDGYHEIETIMYPIGWKDVLEALPAKEFSMQRSSDQLWPVEKDICSKAITLLRKECALQATHVFLNKNIPVGAGLGGGSSDGTFMLKLLNTLYQIDLSKDQMQTLAFQLGTDCPFFLQSESMLATGIGTKLSPVAVDLSGFHLLVVVPHVHVETKWAYDHIQPRRPSKALVDIIAQPVSTWREDLVNHFESVVFGAHPQVGELRNRLYDAGAIYASLSGSGSAVFGLFDTAPEIFDFVAEHDTYAQKL